MNEDTIQQLWNESKRRDERLGSDAIRALLEKSVRREWWSLRANAWVFVGMLAAGLVFLALSLLGPDPRPWLVTARGAVALLALGLLAWNLAHVRRVRALDEPGLELSALARRQLAFFHGPYEGWLWSSALATWILSFALTGWIEDHEGGFRIQRPLEYAAVSGFQILLTYALLRFAHQAMVQRAVAALEDLERQVDDATRRIEARRPLRRLVFVLVFVALSASVALGLYLWLTAAASS